MEALQQCCGAGTECGGCIGVLQQLLAAHPPTNDQRQSTMASEPSIDHDGVSLSTN
jgi:NAD(P)H-nitrite reductase large subunit